MYWCARGTTLINNCPKFDNNFIAKSFLIESLKQSLFVADFLCGELGLAAWLLLVASGWWPQIICRKSSAEHVMELQFVRLSFQRIGWNTIWECDIIWLTFLPVKSWFVWKGIFGCTRKEYNCHLKLCLLKAFKICTCSIKVKCLFFVSLKLCLWPYELIFDGLQIGCTVFSLLRRGGVLNRCWGGEFSDPAFEWKRSLSLETWPSSWREARV